jgi:hypothetical protein
MENIKTKKKSKNKVKTNTPLKLISIMETTNVTKNKAVVIQPKTVVANPSQLLEMAVDKNLDVEKLSKLMELQREYNADVARKNFFNAFMEFQSKSPEIRKTKEVVFGNTKYHYAPLADIVRQLKDAIKDCELSYRWEIKDNKETIEVTCIVTHSDGHGERTTMSASPDTSGSKNSIQARGSAIEYMKRYTLIGALGLTTADTDIDARMPELDIDKLHKTYMELYDKIVEKDEKFRSPGDPDNWAADRTPQLYVQAIGRARQLLANLNAKQA